MTQPTTVSSLIGPWKGVAETSLQERCRDAWNRPFDELSDLEVATFLNQKIAFSQMLVEAKRRLESVSRDDTEYYDGQLEEAVLRADS